jgi:hypothetical protein
MTPQAGKVIVLELNEITWDLLDPLVRKGVLPNFKRMIDEGARGEPWALEVPPHLDPWVTWTSVYTGVTQEKHGLIMLEQDASTVHAPRLWEYLREAGLRIGIFGSANSWPPKPVDGFWVPGPFSRDYQTYPNELEPIQALNIGLTRGHTTVDTPRPRLVKLVPQLVQLGLSLPTMFRLALELLGMKRNPKTSWKKVSLQPLVNLDFFSRLYRRHRPHFATLHSNHVAYYQHRFWRAMDPSKFTVPPTEAEREQYGGCIEYGYRVADEVLGRLRGLAGPDVNIVVLSSCGQQPANSERYVKEQQEGFVGVQIRIKKLLEVMGIADRVRYSNLMAPQWKLDFDTQEELDRTVGDLKASRNLTREVPVFGMSIEGLSICLGATRTQQMDDRIEIHTRSGVRQFTARELLDRHAEVAKSGIHHPKGVLLMHGPGVRPGARVERCDNLDLAPTLLTLLGQAVPAIMEGRVLDEALTAAPVREHRELAAV